MVEMQEKKSDESMDEDQEGHTPNKNNDNEPENENYERKCEVGKTNKAC